MRGEEGGGMRNEGRGSGRKGEEGGKEGRGIFRQYI